MRPLVALVASAVLFLPFACSDDSGKSASTPPSPSDSVTPSETAEIPYIAEVFDIGHGKHLYLECQGEGSPTVLLESGDEAGVGQWNAVSGLLAQETRTCSYERLGVGASDPATGCRDMDDILGDLFALLQVAKIRGPFILVGTSGGGYLSAEHAMRHPERTKGLVILDTFPAITNPPPDVAAVIKCDAPTNIERRDYAKVEHAAWDHRHRIGDIPVVLITNKYGNTAQNKDERHSVALERGWFELSPRSRQIVVTSGHNIPENEPQIVADAVLGMLEEAR